MGKNSAAGKIKAQKSKLKRTVKDCKARIKIECSRYKSAIKNLRTVIKKYDSAYTKYIKKPSDKNTNTVESLLIQLRELNDIRAATALRISSLIEAVKDSSVLLAELIGEDTKAGIALLMKLEKYTDAITARIENMESGVLDALPSEIEAVSEFSTDTDDEEDIDLDAEDTDVADLPDFGDLPDFDSPDASTPAPISQKAPDTAPDAAPSPAPISNAGDTHRATPASSGVTSVNISPINLDVTPMVERAIESTMEHLSEELDRRIRDYIAGMSLPIAPGAPMADPAAPTPVRHSDVTADLEEHVLLEEQHIYEKLESLSEQISALIDGIAEISGTYMTLSAKLKEVADLQKQVNDLQRQTMRDQQGIQVSQRLVNEEQVSLTATQRLIAEKQNEATAAAMAVAEAQSAIADTEEAILAANGELASIMSGFRDSAAELISGHQAMLQSMAKTLETQRAVAERQEEVASRQKETMTAQRQIQKEQRSLSERQGAIPVQMRRAPKKSLIPKEELVDDKIEEQV